MARTRFHSLVKLRRGRLLIYLSRRGMDFAELAERADISLKTVYRIMHGSKVRIHTLHKIASALDVPPDLLLDVGDEG